VCLGDRQLADSEETFDVCDKKCFGPTSLREPLTVNMNPEISQAYLRHKRRLFVFPLVWSLKLCLSFWLFQEFSMTVIQSLT